MLTRAYLDVAGRFESLLRLGIARNVLCVHMLCAGLAYSQRSSVSFGPTVDLALDYTPAGIIRSWPSAQVAVLDQESPSIFFYTLKSPAQFVQTEALSLRMSASEITTNPIEEKHWNELCVLSLDGDSILVITRSSTGFNQKVLLPDASSQHITYGDVNSDRREDLLLFGKKRTGISSLLKQKDGSYKVGPVTFPDLSVSDVKAIDLNGDGIVDLLVLDWLANRLSLFYGIGHGVFSEQVSVEVPAEPASIALTPVTRERSVRIAVCVPDEKLVSLFYCNATGEIEPIGSLTFASAPLKASFVDINNDHIPDLIVATVKSVHVLLGRSENELAPPVAFGAGSSITSYELFDLDADSKPDLVVIDRGSKRLVAYANASWSGSVQWPATYGVGSKPGGITVLDVNNDGLQDIVVANSGSSSLSVLLNLGKGKFLGQQTVSVSEQPVALRNVEQNARGEPMVTVSHANVDKVSIVRFGDDVGTPGVFALPTGSSPYVVLASRDSSTGQLEVLTRYAGGPDGSLALSLFRQLSGGQFLERSIRPVVPGYITALTVDNYSSSGRYDMLFVTNDKATRQSTLSVAYAGRGFDFSSAKQVMTFSDSAVNVRAIIPGYLDNDSTIDLILLMSSPRNGLRIVYGGPAATFKDSVDVIRNVQPIGEDAMIIRDVNGDGHRDLTWIDAGKNAVVTMYGRGNRQFDAPVTICPASRVTAIEIAGLKSVHSQDLVLANGSRGSITVVFDPFAR